MSHNKSDIARRKCYVCYMWLGLKAYHKKNRYSKRQKKNKDKLKKARAKQLERLARRLRTHPPKSEQWFFSLYEKYAHLDDEFNEVFNIYIPDISNRTYKYIIEVDGSYHLRPEQVVKDLKKNVYFTSRGYTVIRVLAYDLNAFDAALKVVLRLRNAEPVLDDNTAAGCPPRNEVASTP